MKLLKISLFCKEKVTFLCRTHVILEYFQYRKQEILSKNMPKGDVKKKSSPTREGTFPIMKI